MTIKAVLGPEDVQEFAETCAYILGEEGDSPKRTKKRLARLPPKVLQDLYEALISDEDGEEGDEEEGEIAPSASEEDPYVATTVLEVVDFLFNVTAATSRRELEVSFQEVMGENEDIEEGILFTLRDDGNTVSALLIPEISGHKYCDSSDDTNDLVDKDFALRVRCSGINEADLNIELVTHFVKLSLGLLPPKTFEDQQLLRIRDLSDDELREGEVTSKDEDDEESDEDDFYARYGTVQKLYEGIAKLRSDGVLLEEVTVYSVERRPYSIDNGTLVPGAVTSKHIDVKVATDEGDYVFRLDRVTGYSPEDLLDANFQDRIERVITDGPITIAHLQKFLELNLNLKAADPDEEDYLKEGEAELIGETLYALWELVADADDEDSIDQANAAELLANEICPSREHIEDVARVLNTLHPSILERMQDAFEASLDALEDDKEEATATEVPPEPLSASSMLGVFGAMAALTGLAMAAKKKAPTIQARAEVPVEVSSSQDEVETDTDTGGTNDRRCRG